MFGNFLKKIDSLLSYAFYNIDLEFESEKWLYINLSGEQTFN